MDRKVSALLPGSMGGCRAGIGIWALAGILTLPLSAATFTAGTNSACTGVSTDSKVDAPVLVSTGYFQCGTVSGLFIGQGSATGRADAGGIGVGVEYYSGGFLTIAQAFGQIDTTFVINGPGTGPIPVSINFELSGFLGGGTDAGQVSYRRIENQAMIQANLPGGAGTLVYDYYGSALETFNAGLNPGLFMTFSGVLAPGGEACLAQNANAPCGMQSPVFEVYAGQVNTLRLWAQATVDSGNGTGNGIASFLNTFGFDPNKPVFNLPDGYTVTVAGLNVVNNRLVDPNAGSEIPEPGTYALVGAGLAAAVCVRRRVRSRGSR